MEEQSSNITQTIEEQKLNLNLNKSIKGLLDEAHKINYAVDKNLRPLKNAEEVLQTIHFGISFSMTVPAENDTAMARIAWEKYQNSYRIIVHDSNFDRPFLELPLETRMYYLNFAERFMIEFTDFLIEKRLNIPQ